MIYVILGVVVVIIMIFSTIYFRIQNRKKMRNRIRSQFGAIPNREFDKEDVKRLMDSEKTTYDIDDITWNDLDMDKVYARINNCNSFVGEQILYRRLHSVKYDSQEVEDRENLIKEFVANEKLREDVQVTLGSLGKRENSYYLPLFMKEIDIFQITNIWFYRVMSFLLAVTLILGVILNQYFLYAAGVVFLINLVVYTFGRLRLELQFGMMGTIGNVVMVANKIIDKYKINDGKLAGESIKSIRKMGKEINQIALIQKKLDQSASSDMFALIFDYLIGSTLWDFHVFYKIVKMLIANQDEFMKIYTYVGEADVTISIASFRKSVPQYCLPCFQNDDTINFAGMYHPLISNPVCNDVKMDSNYIVTGSNASGKSTYIKAVAINMIIAQSINTVLAESATIPHANVLTSMAVRDDVTSGESYYIREINYLKRIIEYLTEDKLTLCIVDEILRGTNTEERIAASVAILDYLNDKNCLAIVASHDVKISEMLAGKFENCHFSEVLEEEDILFDYKVKNGVSKSKNAIKLLKHVGFPEEIVNGAERLVSQMDSIEGGEVFKV